MTASTPPKLQEAEVAENTIHVGAEVPLLLSEPGLR